MLIWYHDMEPLFQETSIELVVIGEDGIVRSICEQPVFGIIKDLAILCWNDGFREATLQVQSGSLCDFFYTITCLRHLKIPLFFKTSLSKDLYFVWWVTSASCFVLCFQTQGKDLLVVLSDSGKLSFLTFSLEMHRLAWFNSLFFFFLVLTFSIMTLGWPHFWHYHKIAWCSLAS